MRILCAVKRVVDYAAKIRVNAAQTNVDTSSVKMSMNPFCEIALEEALRLKEAGIATEVVAVTVGPDAAKDTLRTAMAMGADHAVHVVHESAGAGAGALPPLAVARVLSAVVDHAGPFGMVLAGKQAIDGDNNQTGQMLAALRGWPQATFASSVSVTDGGTHAVVTREVDAGLETVKVPLPAVVTTDLRLNEPRYAKLPMILKARKREIETLSAETLNVKDHVDRDQGKLHVRKVSEPPARAGGVKTKDMDEFINMLGEKGVL